MTQREKYLTKLKNRSKLTTDEAADYLGISKPTLFRRVKGGFIIKHYGRGTGVPPHYLVKELDVFNFGGV